MIVMIRTIIAGSPRPPRGDQDSAAQVSRRAFTAGLGTLASLCASSCSGPGQPSAVDVPLARDALKAAMEQWKNGGDLKSVEASGTKVIAQDPDWAAGTKLVDYQILDDGKPEDVNLRVQVKLTLSNPGGKDKGKPIEKKASYVVGTSPSVTVYRDVMRR